MGFKGADETIIVGQSENKNFEVQHYTETAKLNNGLGRALSIGLNEIYTVAEFRKVA